MALEPSILDYQYAPKWCFEEKLKGINRLQIAAYGRWKACWI